MNNAVVPSGSENDISDIIRIHGLKGQPVFLSVSQSQNYDEKQCHISAKHAAMTLGGHRVHGWVFWKFIEDSGDEITLAFHHSVLEDVNGSLVDVTPPSWPATQTLFLRDDSAIIKLVADVLVFPVTLTPLRNGPFYHNGGVVEHSTWTKPINSVDITSYCTKIGIKPSDIPT